MDIEVPCARGLDAPAEAGQQPVPIPAGCSSSGLPAHLAGRVCDYLPPNDIACTVRLVCRELAETFSSPAHTSVRLDQEVPAHALAWALADGPTRRELAIKVRERMMALTLSRTQDPEDLARLEAALSCMGRPAHDSWTCMYDIRQTLSFVGPALKAEASAQAKRERDPACECARAGNRSALQWLNSLGWPLHAESLLCAAAEHQDLPFLQWLHTDLLGLPPRPCATDRRPSPTVLACAAASCTPDACDKAAWLVRLGCLVSGAALCAAAARGSIKLVEQLAAAGGVVDCRGLAAALAAGQLHVADWLADKGLCSVAAPYGYAHARRGVARRGREDALEWLLLRQPCPPVCHQSVNGLPASAMTAELRPQGALGEALAAGAEPELLDWLVAQGADPRHSVQYSVHAVRSGSVRTARWLLQAGAVFGEDALHAAVARRVDRAMLAFVLEEAGGAGWPQARPRVLSALSSHGSVAALEVRRLWAGGGGGEVPKQGGLVEAACGSGSLAMVRWLVEEAGCTVGPGALPAAARSGSYGVVQLVLQSYGGSKRLGGDAYVAAASQGDVGVLELLWTHEVPWGAGGWGAGKRVECEGDSTVQGRLVEPRPCSQGQLPTEPVSREQPLGETPSPSCSSEGLWLCGTHAFPTSCSTYMQLVDPSNI